MIEEMLGKSNITLNDSKIEKYINEVAEFINKYCDIVTEKGQNIMKFKGDPKGKGIQYIKANLWVKPELQNRKYMGFGIQQVVSGMRFYKSLDNVNIVESVAIPLDLKNNQNNIYYSARFNFDNGLIILDDKAKVIKTIDAETIINKIKEIKDKEKAEDEKEKDNFNFDEFLNDFNDINSGRNGTKKRKTQCQKKQEKIEKERKEKQEKEKQEKELNRQRQFKNKWRGLRNETVNHYNKTQKDIVGGLKEYQKRKNAMEKIKNIATEKDKASFKEGLQTAMINTSKFIQKQKAKNSIKKVAIGRYDKNKTETIKKLVNGLKLYHYKKTHPNYIEKQPYYNNAHIPTGLTLARTYFGCPEDPYNLKPKYKPKPMLNLNAPLYHPKGYSQYK